MEFLTADEIRRLTQRERASAQARELDHLRIPYRKRRNGSLVVLRLHVESATIVTLPREPRLRLQQNVPPSED